jgi:hypothetical protein
MRIEGRADGRTEMRKLTVAFRNFVNAPEKKKAAKIFPNSGKYTQKKTTFDLCGISMYPFSTRSQNCEKPIFEYFFENLSRKFKFS